MHTPLSVVFNWCRWLPVCILQLLSAETTETRTKITTQEDIAMHVCISQHGIQLVLLATFLYIAASFCHTNKITTQEAVVAHAHTSKHLIQLVPVVTCLYSVASFSRYINN